MTYEDQITAKTAAQMGANASGAFVYFYRTRTGRWEVSIETPSSGNYGTCKPVLDPRDFGGYSRSK